MKKSYLIPVDGRKSFYSKAVLIENPNGEKILESYGTVVCKVQNGAFRRSWGGYSATTMRHINAFRASCGFSGMNKKEWDMLPVEG